MTLSSSLTYPFHEHTPSVTSVVASKDKEQISNSIYNVISKDEFRKAVSNITLWEDYKSTPLYSLESLASTLSLKQLLYKDESTRFGLGSFKALGGAYACQCLLAKVLSKRLGKSVSLDDILTKKYLNEIKNITIACATDGNHGRSVAWACQSFGAKCSIILHEHVSKSREDAIAKFYANIIRIKGDYDKSVRYAQELADKHGWFIVSDTSYEGYINIPKWVGAGYGVIADETISQIEQQHFDIPSHVFLQAGVGGFASSVAAFLAQRWHDMPSVAFPKIIVVESEKAPCLSESAKTHKPATITIQSETIMAGLSCGETSIIAWEILSNLASKIVTISDSLVAPTMQLLARPTGSDPSIEAGESGVAGLAALIGIIADPILARSLEFNQKSRVLVVGTEGATDPDIYQDILKQNLFTKQH